MNVSAAIKWGLAVVWTVLLLPGCGDVALEATTSINATPKEVINPLAPDEVRRDAADKKAAKPKSEAKSTIDQNPKKSRTKVRSTPTAVLKLAPLFAPTPVAISPGEEFKPKLEISLEPIKVAELAKKIAAEKKARLTVVDVWSTVCGPCMLNMPHVVAMEKKFRGRGLAIATLSTDDPEDAKAIARAKEFLKKEKAFYVKHYLDATFLDAFEVLDFTTMPAVFLYDADGKLLKKYTWDDPDAQFSYDEVDRSVAAYLDGKPLPKDKGDLPVAK